MKITRRQLKRLIREETGRLNEQEGPVPGKDFMRQLFDYITGKNDSPFRQFGDGSGTSPGGSYDDDDLTAVVTNGDGVTLRLTVTVE